MKNYKKILSLDFEMYNSMHYWSICWIGAIVADTRCRELSRLDVKLNPGTRHKLIGRELKFPFKYSDLKPLGKFDSCCHRLFELIDEDTLVIGHAIDNDVKMMISACDYYNVTCPDFDYIDTNIVHSALDGEFSQLGLVSLAALYGYEFEAHNPVEDAAATLFLLGKMLEKKGITLHDAESLGITLGMVRGSLARKCEAACMSEKAKRHIDNGNAVFDAVYDAGKEGAPRKGRLNGVKMAIDTKLRANQNLYPLIKWAVGEGLTVLGEPRKADVFLTLEIKEPDRRCMSLREFAAKYDAPESAREGLDFYPNKVTLASGEAVSYLQYLRRKYARGNSRETYCFARVLERRFDFEDIASRLLETGARICAVPARRSTFVVDSLERLNDTTDYKIPLYKRLAAANKIKIKTLDELSR